MRDNIEKKIRTLKELIKQWDKEYYIDNNPTVDDYVYDEKLKELIELENQNPLLKTKDSPTQNVSGYADVLFTKEKHEIKMLSLNNSFDFKDLDHFFTVVKKYSKDISFSVEPKIDGISISLIYEDGKFKKAISRGNGEVGENLTQNALSIKELPLTIDLKTKVAIRGEVYMRKDDFVALNQYYEDNQQPLLANPRNAASGTIRQLDLSKIKERKLRMISYFVLDLENKKSQFISQKATYEWLQSNHFKTCEDAIFESDVEVVKQKISEITDKREDFNYEIDGIVLKVNETNLYSGIGSTSKFPKWATAYKFPAEVKTTTLLNIIPTIGRTGRVTYNARLEPVNLIGTIVRNATLHNAQYIKNLDLRIGGKVYIKKAGEIIPKVIGIEKDKNYLLLKKWEEAKACPFCNFELERKNSEVDQYCPNKKCKSRRLGTFLHFISRDGVNVIGLSEMQVKRFIDIGYLKDLYDIFSLQNYKNEILKLERFEKKSTENLLSNIDKARNAPLNQFLFGLGIRYIGKKASLDLAIKFKSLSNLLKQPKESFYELDDFGETKIESLWNYLCDDDNRKHLNKFIENKIDPLFTNTITSEGGMFYNKRVVVSGTIKGGTREETKMLLLQLGAKPTTAISSKTNFLILGENYSISKLKKIDSDKIIRIKDLNELRSK